MANHAAYLFSPYPSLSFEQTILPGVSVLVGLAFCTSSGI